MIDINSEFMRRLRYISTTEMGEARLKNNLDIPVGYNVVGWCIIKILESETILYEDHPKNWYVHTKDFTLTINKGSFGIITGHKR